MNRETIEPFIEDMTRQEQKEALAILVTKVTTEELVEAILENKFDRECRWAAKKLTEKVGPERLTGDGISTNCSPV